MNDYLNSIFDKIYYFFYKEAEDNAQIEKTLISNEIKQYDDDIIYNKYVCNYHDDMLIKSEIFKTDGELIYKNAKIFERSQYELNNINDEFELEIYKRILITKRLEDIRKNFEEYGINNNLSLLDTLNKFKLKFNNIFIDNIFLDQLLYKIELENVYYS